MCDLLSDCGRRVGQFEFEKWTTEREGGTSYGEDLRVEFFWPWEGISGKEDFIYILNSDVLCETKIRFLNILFFVVMDLIYFHSLFLVMILVWLELMPKSIFLLSKEIMAELALFISSSFIPLACI